MAIIIAAIIVFLIVVNAVVMLIMTIPIAKREYYKAFVRKSPDEWTRECSCPENAEHLVMYNAGVDWARENTQFMKEVSIKNDGLKLFGEFYDFGFDKSVVILPGRAEGLCYSYYFAKPYKESGYNVLVIDYRAHGKSDGKYNCVGIKEREDVVKWMELLHEQYHSKTIVLHGLCIGSTICLFLAARNIPYLEKVVSEGPYISFINVLRQRSKTGGHKVTSPVVEEMGVMFLKHAGVNVFKEKPIKYVGKMTTPVLFLCGKEDVSSLPKYSQRLYDKCSSKEKKLVWFEHGAHSHLRINDTEKYDAEIKKFLAE